MSLLKHIEEHRITSECELFGIEVNNIEREIKGIIDCVYDKKECDIDFAFFDIKGTVLLSGITGVGKTSVMKNCMSYALEKYNVDCYELLTPDIISSELGKATQNMSEALKEFAALDRGILFIDELDRFCINRNSDELSELKRMLIEIMLFLERLNMKDGKVVLACTNVIEQIDEALLRRFTISKIINKPTYSDLLNFANVCMEKAGYSEKVSCIPSGIETFDDIKKTFRDLLLRHIDVLKFFNVG